jgi:hypothetical protein
MGSSSAYQVNGSPSDPSLQRTTARRGARDPGGGSSNRRTSVTVGLGSVARRVLRRDRAAARRAGPPPCARPSLACLSALERSTFVCGVINNPLCVIAAEEVIDARLAAVGQQGEAQLEGAG